MKEKIDSVEKLSALRISIGQSDKKVKNSSAEFISMPTSGEFAEITTKEFDIEGVGKVTSLGLATKTGEFVSENAIFANELLEELQQIKSGTRKDKFCLKNRNLTAFDGEFNAPSRDRKLLTLIGAKFNATAKTDCRVYKSEYLDAAKFDEVCVAADTKTNIKSILDKTEVKKLYSFTFAK